MSRNRRSVVLDALIGLAQAQIAALLARGANLDAQALGLIGFDAALAAAVLAAQKLLGQLWWVPIPGLVASMVAGAAVMGVTRFDLGPSPSDFYTHNKDSPNDTALAQLLADLLATQLRIAQPLRLKTGRLVLGLAALLVTMVYSILLIAL